MSITQNQYNTVLYRCDEIWSSIFNSNSGDVVFVPDGTIYADLSNGDGTFRPYQITKVCCDVLKNKLLTQTPPQYPSNVNPNNIYFDLDEQKCRWSETPISSCLTNQPIKIVLNPVGNDGAFFTLTENDTCRLEVSFDYLFKIKCSHLAYVLDPSKYAEAVGLTPGSGGALIPARVNTTELRQNKFAKESELLDINNELESLSKQAANISYSIVCNDFPTTEEVVTATPTTEITPAQKLPFINTGFGSLTNETLITTSKTKVAPVYETKSVNFCLTDAGLDAWRLILGDNNYNEFINGNPDSYTCLDVIEIDKQNQESVITNGNNLIFECETPFGEKTNLLNQISELAEIQKKIKNDIKILDDDIIGIRDIVDPCSSLIGQFENISASASLDLIDENNNITQIHIDNFFPTHPNLYEYLTQTQDNSGFFVCGDPSTTETWASGCTGLVYPEFTYYGVIEDDEELNVSICKGVKDELQQKLFDSSNIATLSGFNSSLSSNVFNSNWLTHSFTIDDQRIISGSSNNYIKLNIIINSSCDNFCLLIDQINMTKVCDDANRTNIFISESPGFEITRIIDNKKSWLQVENTTDRNFFVANYDDSNKIRQTEYTVDEDRLILNSKEIDLTMNMASAVENDVWCYLLDNSNLLTGTTCDTSSGVTPTDIYGNKITLPTAQTYTYNVSDLIDLSLSYYSDCLKYAEAVGLTASVAIPAKAVSPDIVDNIVGDGVGIFCLPESECMECGEALKFKFDNNPLTLNPQYDEFWVVCDINGLSAYVIEDPTDAQNTIYNITNSLTGSAISELTNLANIINIKNLDAGIPQQYNIFWDSTGDCASCCSDCGDESINFTGFMTTNITEVNTLETFENLMVSELTDAKNRKVLSAYPTLRAVYDRYMNATQYGVSKSSEFTYEKMDKFTGLIKSYWDDLIEQVVPATTIWGSVKVYTNTMFDQQKFKYRSYTSLFCNSPLNFVTPPSPINGSEGQCQLVEVITTNINPFAASGTTVTSNKKTTYNSVCLSQMNWGSEFVGNVDIQNNDGSFNNYDNFCKECTKNIKWYSMVDKPDYLIPELTCIGSITGVTHVITGLTVNGVNYITTPISSTTITNNSLFLVNAENNVVSGCSASSGWTYLNFVSFLSKTFMQLNLFNYTAILSLIEKTDVGVDCSKNGFYISYPENDTFSLSVKTSSDGYSSTIIYTNEGILTENVNSDYYCSTSNGIDYDCLANKIN